MQETVPLAVVGRQLTGPDVRETLHSALPLIIEPSHPVTERPPKTATIRAIDFSNNTGILRTEYSATTASPLESKQRRIPLSPPDSSKSLVAGVGIVRPLSTGT